MRQLILIRHANTQLDPEMPPHQWGLTQEGRQRCVLLAEKLEPHHPEIIFTSFEPKAVQTGEIVAQRLGLPCRVGRGLHEHERERGPIISREKFLARVASLFSNPDQLVLGRETARQAQARCPQSVQSIMDETPHNTVAIVTHGTVMALFYAQLTAEDGYRFWQSLGLPAFCVVSWPAGQVLSRVMQIE